MAKSQLQLALETYRAQLLSFDSRVLAATSAAYAPIKAALLQQIDELSALQGRELESDRRRVLALGARSRVARPGRGRDDATLGTA